MKSITARLHHFFVPKEHNNFRARALHLHMLASYLVFFLALGFFINLIQAKSNVLGYATDITVEKLFKLTNEERTKEGLTPLTQNSLLAQAAEKKGRDMFARNYWAHYGPDGTTPWSFILSTGYKYEYAGENLAKNFMFSDGVVQAWMDSPTHRENILRPEYREIGFAVVNGMLNGEETTLVVQMFGTPLAGESGVANQPAAPSAEEQTAPALDTSNSAEPQYQIVPKEQSQPEILSKQSSTTLPWMRILYNWNMLFIVFLIGAFALDLYIAIKLNIVHLRVSGKTIAHILFLGFILTGLVIMAQGKIL